MLHFQPDFTIEKIGPHYVLRDDLLPGGTKYRGLNILLEQISDDQIFYPGTIMGHGALALAQACKDCGKQAHIFICGEQENPMIRRLENSGAIVHRKDPATISTLYGMVKEHGIGHTVFPPGFDMPEFKSALVKSLSALDIAPYSEIWTTSVTGTLTSAIAQAFPDKKINTVSVVKSGSGDYFAPEKYHKPAKNLPPYPSCPYTDAKLWQFAARHAASDALIWNTAG